MSVTQLAPENVWHGEIYSDGWRTAAATLPNFNSLLVMQVVHGYLVKYREPLLQGGNHKARDARPICAECLRSAASTSPPRIDSVRHG